VSRGGPLGSDGDDDVVVAAAAAPDGVAEGAVFAADADGEALAREGGG